MNEQPETVEAKAPWGLERLGWAYLFAYVAGLAAAFGSYPGAIFMGLMCVCSLAHGICETIERKQQR